VKKIWTESGYADFADGIFGNGGQNLYVSKAGILQRIFHFDPNQDGHVDLLFVNSQDMDERPPVYVYRNPLDNPALIELPTQGAYFGAVGDLNGDGYDDLVIANQNNGPHSDVTAFIYYGSPEGLSERYKAELPAPNSRGVAIGDFNGDGRADIAFASEGKLRIFYQTPSGFLPGKFADLDLEVTHLVADDLDGDGCADLYVRVRNGPPRILWGGPEGIDLHQMTVVGGEDFWAADYPSTTPAWLQFAEGWAPKILKIGGRKYVFRSEGKEARLYPIDRGRAPGEPVRIECEHAVSAAAGDINRDGHDDLVIAVCNDRNEAINSWVYWGTPAGLTPERRTPLSTISARDVVIADLNGNGFPEIVICQGRTDELHTTHAAIFGNGPEGLATKPKKLITHDASTVLVGRTCDDSCPQLIFINHVAGRVRGDVPAYLYLGGPKGYSPDRKVELPGWSAPDAQCCDFNDKGWADILILNCAENAPHLDPGSFLYWGGPEGFHPDRKQILPTLRAHGSAVGDFRRCGYLDLAVGGFSNPELLIFPGGPQGFDLGHPQRILMDNSLKDYIPSRDANWNNGKGIHLCEPRWLLAADFNNDGWLDLFVSQISGPHSFILWGGPEGFSMERSTWLAVEGAACAHAADLTGNGWLDLIVAGHQAMSKKWRYDSYIYIYWGGPDGYREDRRCQLPAHTCNSLAVADFNRDGILDIFATSYNGGRDRDLDAYIYWGGKGGNYSMERRTRLFTHSSCGCIAGDFNEDGWIDLAVANHKTFGNHVGFSEIWWNGPEGFSENRITRLPTNGPHGMIAVPCGNIVDRGPEEYYISSPYELPEGKKVKKISWQARTPPKTWVKAQIRSSPTRDQLSKAPWQGPDEKQYWFENGQSPSRNVTSGRWIQYRLALGAANGGSTPRISRVDVEYE
jgi:hypothetical protein